MAPNAGSCRRGIGNNRLRIGSDLQGQKLGDLLRPFVEQVAARVAKSGSDRLCRENAP